MAIVLAADAAGPRAGPRRRCAAVGGWSWSSPAEGQHDARCRSSRPCCSGISVIGSIVGTRADLAEVFELHASAARPSGARPARSRTSTPPTTGSSAETRPLAWCSTWSAPPARPSALRARRFRRPAIAPSASTRTDRAGGRRTSHDACDRRKSRRDQTAPLTRCAGRTPTRDDCRAASSPYARGTRRWRRSVSWSSWWILDSSLLESSPRRSAPWRPRTVSRCSSARSRGRRRACSCTWPGRHVWTCWSSARVAAGASRGWCSGPRRQRWRTTRPARS